MRVDQQRAGGGRLGRAVVVDDDDIRPERAQVGHLLAGVGAAIERDEQVRLARLQRAVDGRAREAVTFLGAARHHVARGQPQPAQQADQDRRAAHAVDVVVAEHGDALLLPQGLPEPVHGGIEAGQQERIPEGRERGRKEA